MKSMTKLFIRTRESVARNTRGGCTVLRISSSETSLVLAINSLSLST
jgi:hypothetical protein